MSKTEIVENVWDDAFVGDLNIVEVYVRYLRKKIDEPFGRAAIETVRGAGYRLDPDGGLAGSAVRGVPASAPGRGGCAVFTLTLVVGGVILVVVMRRSLVEGVDDAAPPPPGRRRAPPAGAGPRGARPAEQRRFDRAGGRATGGCSSRPGGSSTVPSSGSVRRVTGPTSPAPDPRGDHTTTTSSP